MKIINIVLKDENDENFEKIISKELNINEEEYQDLEYEDLMEIIYSSIENIYNLPKDYYVEMIF